MNTTREIKWLDRFITPLAPFLCLCLSEGEYLKALKHLGVTPTAAWANDDANATLHTYDKVDAPVCIVCLNVSSKLSAIEIAGVLVHESVHIWQEWCKRYGETNAGNEQEAYAIQFISSALMGEYARRAA